MYDVPCLTDNEILYHANRGTLFRTLYGIEYRNTPRETGEALRKLRRGWFCVRCGWCCLSCTIDRRIIFPPTTFRTPQRFSYKLTKTLLETGKEINLCDILCPHFVGFYPGNTGCAIHRLNAKLQTPCATLRPNACFDTPCLRGILWIHTMDVDVDWAIKHFNTLKNNKAKIIY